MTKARSLRFFICFSGLLCLLSLSPLPAQESQEREEPQTTIRAVSESVVLDVVVRDKRGRPVRDLRPEEVEIYENGVKQEITSFRFAGESGQVSGPAERAPLSAEGEAEGGAAADQAISDEVPFDPFQQISLVAFVFERLPDTARQMARKAALHYVDSAMRENTLAAVFAVDNRLYSLEHFTNRRERLREAILKATSGAYGEFDSQSSATVQGQVVELTRRLDRDPTEQAVEGGRSETPSLSELQEAALEEITLNVLRQTQRMMRYQRGHIAMAALQALVEEQGKLSGRKSLVLFSQGLQVPPDVVNRYRNLISQANRSNVSIYTVDARGLTPEKTMEEVGQLLNQAVTSSRQQMLTGLGRMVTRDEVLISEHGETAIRLNKQGTLDDLARSTGGFLVANTNDPRELIDRVSEDLRSYYEVAYSPSPLVYDGKFREISVKVSRPDVSVQSRSGYFAVPFSREEPIESHEIPMLIALNSGIMPADFEYKSRVLHFERNGGERRHSLVIEVPLGTFSYLREEESATYMTRFSILALLKDAQGTVIRKFTEDYPLEGPLEKLDMVRAGSVVFSREFQLPAGYYTVESAVVDWPSQRTSTRRSRLVVPAERSGVRMSSLSVIRRMDPLSEGSRADAAPFQYEDQRIIPNLAGTVVAGPETELGLYCIIYPAEEIRDLPILTLEVIQNGEILARGTREIRPPAESSREIRFVGTLPIEGLTPGEYLLRARVQQGNQVDREHAFFSVADARQRP